MAAQHRGELEVLPEKVRVDRLCELNVQAQLANVCRTQVVRDAWQRCQELELHGWVYGLDNGLLHDLEGSVTGPEALA